MKVLGVDDINQILSVIAPKEGINLMRTTVHGMAGRLAKSAKGNMSDLINTGAMRAGTKAKRKRGTKTTVESDVVVEGAFYWRYNEYGQGPDGIEHAMFLKALEEMRPDVSRVYGEEFGKKLSARLARLAKKAG